MPSNFDALAVVLLAIVPGFIASALWSRTRTLRVPRGQFQTVLESVAWSAVIQVLAAPLSIWWVLPVRDSWHEHPWRVAAWAAAVVLALPALLGLGGALLFHFARLKGWSIAVRWREWPTAWDYLCNGAEIDGKFVLVEFDDGKRVGGWFGEGGRYITSPDTAGIFLTPEWIVDGQGNFVKEYVNSAGLLIPDLADVRVVRLIDPSSDSEEVIA